MKNRFLTFGGPTKNYHDAVDRLCNQAKSFEIFNEIIGYKDNDLKKYNDFYTKHENFIKNNNRGYGYWIWKPFLILKTLEKMDDGDVLLYCDSGCELNIFGKEKMNLYIKNMRNKIIQGTSASTNDFSYTKIDLIKYFGLQNDIDILRKPQMQACVLLIKKNKNTLSIFKEFYNICSNNYHFIDDTPSTNKEGDRFIEHRHDQSVFSLLMKKKKILNYDLDPTVFYPNWIRGRKFPIWSIRNRTGVSLVSQHLKNPFKMMLKTILNKN